MTSAPFIGLEIHDSSIWSKARVLEAIETMQAWGYNALVLHQNDLLDACTQLGLTANFGVSDLRLKKVRNNAAWLNELTDRLGRFGASLFLEIKEPSYHDYALELFPNLMDSYGRPELGDPDWQALCRQKTFDLISRVPEIGGFIVNLSSPESRISLPDHLAVTDADFDKPRWFDAMIAAFHQPLAAAGKALFIRDFSYTTEMQSDVLDAVRRCGGNVGSSVKVTAHDYFPEFPENPVLATAPEPILVEFEAFGEHTGWGVIPNCRVAEFCQRMVGCRAAGAAGILVRTSWEAIADANALDGLSAVNVFALPRLIYEDADALDLVVNWLTEVHGLTEDQAHQAAELMLKSWRIPAASYWDGAVFPRHSCLPSTWQEGWLSMETCGMGRRDRKLGIEGNDLRLTDLAGEVLFADKAAATEFAHRLAAEASALAEHLPAALAKYFQSFAWLPLFARQFELAITATFYAARGNSEDIAALQMIRTDLFFLADDIARRLKEANDLPKHHYVLFDPQQIRSFASSLPS